MSSAYSPAAKSASARNVSPSSVSGSSSTHDDQWWGYNKEHGWVVLDRSLDINKPGLKEQLFFLRCKDMTTFAAKRDTWNAPLYIYAPKYLSALGPELAADAAVTLEGFKARWPELQLEIQRQYQESLPKPVEPPPPVKRVRKSAKKVAAPTADESASEEQAEHGEAA